MVNFTFRHESTFLSGLACGRDFREYLPSMKLFSDERSDEAISALPPRNTLKAVIFDLDGVLIDSSEGIIEATNFALRSVNQLPRSSEEIRKYIGASLSEMFESFTDIPFEVIRPHFRSVATELVVNSSVALSFATDILERLKSHSIPTAIGTTKTRKHTELIVEKLGWGELVETLACGDEAKQKPEPDIFNLALERIGVDASEALVVGDTVNDVLAARSAGIRVVTIESPFGDKPALSTEPPDAHFQDLNEFYAMLFEKDSCLKKIVA